MGAMVALVAAARRPAVVERLVLIDIGPDAFTTPLAAELPALLADLGTATYDEVDDAVHQWAEGNPLAQLEPLRHYVEHGLRRRADGRLVWRFDAAGLTGFVRSGATEAQLWSALDALTAPTLLIRGEHSAVLSPATAQEIARPAASRTVRRDRRWGPRPQRRTTRGRHPLRRSVPAPGPTAAGAGGQMLRWWGSRALAGLRGLSSRWPRYSTVRMVKSSLSP
jgi:pimeloyl-ACP methyl ester carboxylesterase